MSTKVELIKDVTRRLVTSLLWLIAGSAAILIGFLVTKQPISVWGVVMTFGICGGFIGVQRRLKEFTEEDLQLLASSWPYVFLSPLAGGILAVILYMLFVSQLLSGELFPSFEPGRTEPKDFSRLLDCTAKAYTDYAKIIVWSFIAGFSESFVTDIIGSFAKSAQPKTPTTIEVVPGHQSSPGSSNDETSRTETEAN
jgi:phosphate/sulfate permease